MIEPVAGGGKTAAIPPKSNRKNLHIYAEERYKARRLIENFVYKLKHFRAIATRSDKLLVTFSPPLIAPPHHSRSIEDARARIPG
jgi:transposase